MRLAAIPDPVLVSWGESRMALAATRAFGRAGVPAAVLAEAPHAPAWASRHCVQRIAAPDADCGSAYVDFLQKLTQAHRYSGLFCCDDRTVLHLGRERHRFEHLPLLLPDQRWIELSLDKHAMARFAFEQGIPLPRSVFPASAADFDAAVQGLRYPLVIKGLRGSGASDVAAVDDAVQGKAAFALLHERQQQEGLLKPPQVQEWVAGDVYSALILCHHGRALSQFQMRKLRTLPVAGGVCVEAISVDHPGLQRAVLGFLEHFSWHGVLEIEFIHDPRDDRFLLVEPSPDPNWGLDLAVHCGFNLPMLAWRLMQGDVSGATQDGYAVGRRYVWWLPEGAMHLLARPRSLFPMLAATCHPGSGADLRQRDWRPIVQQLRRTVWSLRQRGRASSA